MCGVGLLARGEWAREHLQPAADFAAADLQPCVGDLGRDSRRARLGSERGDDDFKRLRMAGW